MIFMPNCLVFLFLVSSIVMAQTLKELDDVFPAQGKEPHLMFPRITCIPDHAIPKFSNCPHRSSTNRRSTSAVLETYFGLLIPDFDSIQLKETIWVALAVGRLTRVRKIGRSSHQ
jgi:hypothetical protein